MYSYWNKDKQKNNLRLHFQSTNNQKNEELINWNIKCMNNPWTENQTN